MAAAMGFTIAAKMHEHYIVALRMYSAINNLYEKYRPS
jgi:hypothetical protein